MTAYYVTIDRFSKMKIRIQRGIWNLGALELKEKNTLKLAFAAQIPENTKF